MRSFLAGAAAAVLLTGCGTALAQSGTGHSGGRPRTAVVVTGSRAEAQAYVRHLMAELSLPAGSVPAQPLPVLQRISAHAPFNEPVIYSATPAFLNGRPPAPAAVLAGRSCGAWGSYFS